MATGPPPDSATIARCGCRGTRSSGSWSDSRPSRTWRLEEFRCVLARTRRLGRNPENGAIAVLAIYREQVLVAILQRGDLPDRPDLEPVRSAARRVRPERSCPRKWGRVLRRLSGDE